MSSHTCNGPKMEATGSIYCPFAPELDDWDCDECKRGREWAEDLAVDYQREKCGWGE
jgi:hypothetical protein